MGFFDRKRVKKASPEPAKPAPLPANANAVSRPPPPPPPPSRYATSTTQTPPYWQPQPPHQQHQLQQPPPPYHHPQQQQQQHPAQQPHRPQGWSQPYPQRAQYPQPIVVNQHYYLHPPPSHLALPAPPPPSQNSGVGVGPYSHGTGTGAAPASQTCPLGLDKFTGSVANIAKDFASPQFFDEPNFHPHATQLINSTAACVDQISSCFNDVMTLIDREGMAGHERALFTYQPAPAGASTPPLPGSGSEGDRKKGRGRDRGGSGGKGGGSGSGSRKKSRDPSSTSAAPKGQNTAVAATAVSGSYFAKVEMYANARLPMNLPPLRLYMPTWPLLCMAARYAERVYEHPKGAERDAHVSADWKTGTKAMVIKSVPMDHMNTIVFAIRGSATFMDWAVNLNTAPAPPAGFLDDPGNSCHAGFLTVARKMVRPVAARLRQLLEEDPARSAYSLLITGHSAGGAVAALLYSHMLATSPAARSELNTLTACFKRVHCVTFGTPPVSLLPLARPDRPELRKSLFLTFVNEGDPVARADKAYVRSLLELFASPAPSPPKAQKHPSGSSSSSAAPISSALVLVPGGGQEKKSSGGGRLAAKASKMTLRAKESKMSLAHACRESRDHHHPHPPALPPPPPPSERDRRARKPVWQLPPGTLSSPGRIVVLRSGDPRAGPKDRKTVAERLDEGVVAQTASDEDLRGVVWGDPVCHVMKLYSGRIEILAVGAVTGKH
ncbi:hypothetical protein EsH8_IX_000858 [Colletotrichum jinshuiense]